MKYFLLLLIIQASTSFAFDKGACFRALELYLDPVHHNREDHNIGTLDQLPQLLEAAGYPSGAAHRALEYLKFISESAVIAADPVARVAQDRLVVMLNSKVEHVICSPNRACRLEGIIALAQAQLDFLQVPLYPNAPGSIQIPEELLKTIADIEGHHTIFLGSYDQSQPEFLISAIVFHEILHLSDNQLLNRWFQKNIAALSAKQATDPIFDKVYRKIGRFHTMDESFVKLFVESRAYYVEAIAYNALGKAGIRPFTDRTLEDYLDHQGSILRDTFGQPGGPPNVGWLLKEPLFFSSSPTEREALTFGNRIGVKLQTYIDSGH